MRPIGLFRFSMGTIMMFVLMSASAMALFVKVHEYTRPLPMGWKLDVPVLFLVAIGLTSMALGFWKDHSASQVMLQIAIACVGCLTLIWVAESEYERAVRYWCQSAFAVSVTLPMLARRLVKSRMPHGPRRDWWKKSCEAVFFSFLTVILVSAGAMYQGAVYFLAMEMIRSSRAAAVAPLPSPVAPAPPPMLAPPVVPPTPAGPAGPAKLSDTPPPLNDDELGLVPEAIPERTPEPKAARKAPAKP